MFERPGQKLARAGTPDSSTLVCGNRRETIPRGIKCQVVKWLIGLAERLAQWLPGRNIIQLVGVCSAELDNSGLGIRPKPATRPWIASGNQNCSLQRAITGCPNTDLLIMADRDEMLAIPIKTS